MQWDESKKKEKSDVGYGGSGYGANRGPTCRTPRIWSMPLRLAARRPTIPPSKRRLAFISRCQNLESEHNTTEFATKVNDGGFYYNPMGTPDRELQTPNGGLRSYGSMTYSGLKSMIYAGLAKDDPRVKAAYTWIRKNYDVKSNPGMGDAGLFYYYHTFSKALDVLGIDEIEDAKASNTIGGGN